MTDYNAETRRLPRWVKIAGLTIAILAILGVLAMVLLGGGEHGPSRHGKNSTPSNESPAAAHPPGPGEDLRHPQEEPSHEPPKSPRTSTTN